MTRQRGPPPLSPRPGIPYTILCDACELIYDDLTGNGCVNDFSRTLSAHVWESQLRQDAVAIFSGGTEGILSPHVNFIVEEKENTGLIAGVGRTRKLEPHEVGTEAHVFQVADTIGRITCSLGLSSRDIGLVLIKCPLLTSAKIEAIRAGGRTPLTTDTYESMAKSRYASAVGVALSLGEIAPQSVEAALEEQSLSTNFASCSSGAELDSCHIIVLAASPTPGPFGIVSGCMNDAIDAPGILSLLRRVEKDGGKMVQVFSKAEAAKSGMVRTYRHTMNTDSDIHSTRHARAAVGALIAGLTGDCHLYVSGGAEGQGPPGGGGLCIVYSRNM